MATNNNSTGTEGKLNDIENLVNNLIGRSPDLGNFHDQENLRHAAKRFVVAGHNLIDSFEQLTIEDKSVLAVTVMSTWEECTRLQDSLITLDQAFQLRNYLENRTFELERILLRIKNEAVDSKMLKRVMDMLMKQRSEEFKQLDIEAKQVKQTVADALSEKSKLDEQLQAIREKYEPTIKTLEQGVVALHFEDIANEYEKQASHWQLITNEISIALIFLVSFFICFSYEDVEAFSKLYNTMLLDSESFRKVVIGILMTKTILIKFVLLTIIFFLLKFSMNNYKALMHNAIIYRHKASAFDTLNRLMISLNENDLKAKLLDMGTKEIFNQHKTGYLDKDGEKIDLGIIEKLATIFKK